jgi:hypothetical protein
MYVSERPFQFSDLAKAVQRSAGLGQATCPDGTLDCLVDPAVAASEATEQAINTAQLTSGNSGYYTTIGGVSISNSVLVIGGLLIAGLVFFGAAKK